MSLFKKQHGGLEPLLKLPKFKYTFHQERKTFISHVYSYAPYLLSCITSIPFHSYSYKGNCEYLNFEDKKEKVVKCKSDGSPIYSINGGAVYEILNRKYENINLHDYCDATGDVDVSVYPPRLTEDEEFGVYFFNADGKISDFYSHFTTWIFNNMVKNIKSIQKLFEKVSGFIDFEINDYNDIPNGHKRSEFGYHVEMCGKLCVVAFLNEDISMFKIQVVCNIKDNDTSSIDHVIEIIIPLPESDIEFSPSTDQYSPPKYEIIQFNGQKFNVQNYKSLISDNVNAYLERKNAYGAPNEKEVIHKPINHIARLLYLFELMYRNKSLFEINKYPLLFLFGLKKSQVNKLQYLYYYKLVDNKFETIKIDTRFLFNSYLELIYSNNYSFNIFKNQNPNYFTDENNATEIKMNHKIFNKNLFNNNLFEPNRILTFGSIDDISPSKRSRSVRSRSRSARSRSRSARSRSRSARSRSNRR